MECANCARERNVVKLARAKIFVSSATNAAIRVSAKLVAGRLYSRPHGEVGRRNSPFIVAASVARPRMAHAFQTLTQRSRQLRLPVRAAEALHGSAEDGTGHRSLKTTDRLSDPTQPTQFFRGALWKIRRGHRIRQHTKDALCSAQRASFAACIVPVQADDLFPTPGAAPTAPVLRCRVPLALREQMSSASHRASDVRPIPSRLASNFHAVETDRLAAREAT